MPIDEYKLKSDLYLYGRTGNEAAILAWRGSLSPEELAWVQNYIDTEIIPGLDNMLAAFGEFTWTFVELIYPTKGFEELEQWVSDNH